MKILRTFSEAAAYFDQPTALTIGVFDGVHLGHQKLLERTRHEAAARGLSALAITFHDHPLTLLAPPYAPRRLTTPAQKLRLLEALGLDATLELTFTPDLASMQPEHFVKACLLHACQAKVIICGYDFTFGAKGRGNISLLRSIAEQAGTDVIQEEALTVDGIAVKSTHIRDLVFSGQVNNADRLLGRPYEIHGKVVKGHARGRTIGYPTANLQLAEDLALPATGVYYCNALVEHQDSPLAAMVNIGVSPTFGQNAQTVEAHLLDFQGDLVDQSLCLQFHTRLRDEIKFPSVEHLVAQLKEDEGKVRSLSRA